jgi:hypothetical protein
VIAGAARIKHRIPEKRAMGRGPKALTRAGAPAVAAALWLGASAVLAQASSAPPPPPAPAAAPARPAPQKPAAPRRAIELTPAERQAIDAAESARDKPARVDEALAPTAEDIKPRPADETPNTTRIDQTYVSNRVYEVIVTPAGQSRSYIMYNREGQQPYSTTQMNSGLSVPMFFRFEFGRSTPPAANPPPPPAPSPSR